MLALLALPILLASVLGAPGQAGARGTDMFLVEGLRVEQRAENAVAAKEQALDELYVRALSTLFRRLARSADLARLPVPTRDRAASLMAYMKIEEEQARGTRYAVVGALRFEPVLVRRVFERAGVRIHTRPGPDTLLVPIHVTAGEARAYSGASAWSSALAGQIHEPWLVRLKLAQGTRQDLLEPVRRLREADRVSLSYLRVRYGTQGAMIAEYTDAAEGRPAMLRLAGDTGAGWFDTTVPVAGDIADPMAHAAGLIPALLDDNWKAAQTGGPMGGVRINGVPMSGASAPRPAAARIAPVADLAGLRMRLTSLGPDDGEERAGPRAVHSAAPRRPGPFPQAPAPVRAMTAWTN